MKDEPLSAAEERRIIIEAVAREYPVLSAACETEIQRTRSFGGMYR